MESDSVIADVEVGDNVFSRIEYSDTVRIVQVPVASAGVEQIIRAGAERHLVILRQESVNKAFLRDKAFPEVSEVNFYFFHLSLF